jgi:hypothetical protein
MHMCFENPAPKVEPVGANCKKNIQTPYFPKQNGFIQKINLVNLSLWIWLRQDY